MATATQMKTVKKLISYRHISDGKRCNMGSCPIAIALSELTTVPVEVGDEHYWFGDIKFNTEMIPLPHEVRKFIRTFDKGLSVEETEFEFRIPTKFLKSEG